MGDHISEEEKTRRIVAVNERQRAIQIRRNTALIGRIEQVHVQSRHQSQNQWIGHTAQHRTLNFTHAADSSASPQASLLGAYVDVRVLLPRTAARVPVSPL
jgi:tRNA A37 methylthiotransferase MiaB